VPFLEHRPTFSSLPAPLIRDEASPSPTLILVVLFCICICIAAANASYSATVTPDDRDVPSSPSIGQSSPENSLTSALLTP
jgi:hypothetical protein